MMRAAACIALAAAALAGPAARAAPPRTDPDWPCIQRLVPVLAAGTYWTGPAVAEGADWRADPAVAGVVAAAAPRSVSIAAGTAMLDAFADGVAAPARARVLAETFAGLVDETNRQRGDVIARIKELARRQREVGDVVARLDDELRSLPAAGDAAARHQEIDQRRTLVIRGFEETERTIRYACDVPVQLEARLGAYGRALQARL